MELKRYFKYIISLLAVGDPYNLIKEISFDNLSLRNNVFDNEIHVKSAINWLLAAQNSQNDGGVSASYSLYGGWQPSYSETTGYIISTLFNYYHLNKKQEFLNKIIRMANWELSKQLEEGAFPGGAVGDKEFPIVFNTGQVLFGIVRTFQETNDIKYKESAIKAADWLVKVQDLSGCWSKFTYLGQVHTYNTRVAWSLLRVYDLTKNSKYKQAAIRNINWALGRQTQSGWYSDNSFKIGQEPLLHTIAYSIRGILEAGINLNNKDFINSIRKPSDILLTKIRKDGSLAGSFDVKWNSSVKWSCLTGNSQMSIIWSRLYRITGDEKYLLAAKKVNRYMKSTQNLNSKNKGIKGGIKGAFPIYGWYAPFNFINWAAKFYIDSLMLEDDLILGDNLS